VSRLRPEKLHVRFGEGAELDGPVAPRRYTLTHSDSTGDLFLSVDSEYDRKQVAGWYTRLMRDEVLAEWRDDGDGPGLHVHCHVSGGLVLGTGGWRYAIFRHELALVLEAFRYGDRQLIEARPELDSAPIRIRFRSHRRQCRRTEQWGTPADYRL
jgi:hypothetical protein